MGDSYKGTPFERGKYPEAGYDEWKRWWETEEEDVFDTSSNFLTTFIYRLQTWLRKVF